MQRNEIQFLINSARTSEKKYNWLEAKNSYKEASKTALGRRDFSKVAEFNEQIGYCYYRAALQAETKGQFKNRMRLSSQAYNNELEFLKRNQGTEARAYHASAMVAYTSSCYELNLSNMETLLQKWWTLESKALVTYEEEHNLIGIGKTCNNLMEYSADRLYFFDYREYINRTKKLIDIGEKAIAALEKTNNKYELARAYCWTAWYYGKGTRSIYNTHKNIMKSHTYSKKALSLSEEVGDGWLIGWSYNNLSGMSRRSQTFSSWLDVALRVLEQGIAIKDNYMMVTGKWKLGLIIEMAMKFEEDPEKKRRELWKGVKWTREAIAQAKIINAPICLLLAQFCYCRLLLILASLETDLQEKKKFVEEASKVGKEGLEYSNDRNWVHSNFPKLALADALRWLSKIETDKQEKRRLLEESLRIRTLKFSAQGFASSTKWDSSKVPRHVPRAAFHFALTKSEIAKIETSKDQKIELFNEAVFIWEKCLQNAENYAQTSGGPSTNRFEGFYYYDYGGILNEIYELTQEKPKIKRAIEVYNKAIKFFKEFNLPIHAAESHWKLASIHSQMGDHLEAARNYDIAAKEYEATIEKTPQLRTFCDNYSKYMFAWSEIETAMYHHTREEPHESQKHYENAARLHEEASYWSFMAPNYWAWAALEEAELLSRQENLKEAIQAFEKAQTKFGDAERAVKEQIKEIELDDEKQAAEKLIKSSNLRSRYCQARISLEEAKVFDRKGEYASSSKYYGLAADKLRQLLDEAESPHTQQELSLLVKLCEAWELMEQAEEKAAPEQYIEAAQLFEQAKTYSFNKKTTLLALGNSSFCKGLAAGLKYQSSLDLNKHSLAKGHLKSATISYLQAGFVCASEYAKATQRLFDANVFMNRAESEVDPKDRARQYQMAERLLQVSANSFMRAKQPEKTAQVQQILRTVREEKALAISLNEVLHAPPVTSSTMSFAAPTPTNEASVGLERFEHANVQANLIVGVKEVKVGESFCLTVEFVNAGKEPALLMRVENFVPPHFTVVKKPEIYRLEESCLNMKGKQLAPLKLVEANLVLQPSKKGTYQLKPLVHYLDELGQNRSLRLKSVEIKVEEIILANRVSTGTKELDSLMLGGIPKEYAVVMTGPPSDEREMLIKNFLEAGTEQRQVTFYVSADLLGVRNLLQKSNFYFFLCNLKLKDQIPDLPNVYKLHGKTDLNNLGIALIKAYRSIDPNAKSPKRICVSILSDVLVNYGVKATRKWISELITNLSSKGFTMLAVFDTDMHPADEANAVLNLFDGEISLHEIVDEMKRRKSVRIEKLGNQDYIENPIFLTKQR